MNDSGLWIFFVIFFILGMAVGGGLCNKDWRRNIENGKVSLVVSTNVVTNVVKEIVVK